MNFLTKRAMFVYIQHIDAMLLCFCLVLDHKCGKNEKSGTRSRVLLMFLPHFDIFVIFY